MVGSGWEEHVGSTGYYLPVLLKRRKRWQANEPILRRLKMVLRRHRPTTVVDIGAGSGAYVRALRELGHKAWGLDGTPGIEEITAGDVLEQDLVLDCSAHFDSANWGIFIEVGEHVPKEFEQTLIDNVCRIPTQGLIVSWNPSKRVGIRHVNPRTNTYIACEFGRRDWQVDEAMTRKIRKRGDERISPRFLNTLMVLRKHHVQ